MDEEQRKKLDEYIKYAEGRGIQVPADVLTQIVKENVLIQVGEYLAKRKQINPDDLPIFTLLQAGAVPAPMQKGLILTSTGWDRVSTEPIIVSGGGGGHTTGGGGGVTNHSLLTNLDYATSGHTGFQPTLTATAALALILTVDGAGSGLDADLLDGQHAAAFQPVLTIGNLTATSPLVFNNPRSVIGGAADVSIPKATAMVDGYLAGADFATFSAKQNALAFPLAANLGGTGVANLAASTLTLGAATTITGGGTIGLRGFTLTVPATGTAARKQDTLAVFAGTTPGQLRQVISGYTGAGNLVFNTRPTLINSANLVQILTDDASITWNMDNGDTASVSIAGNRAMANPTNLRAGGRYTLYIQQDATGGRTVSWGSSYMWDWSEIPVLNTSAYALSIFGFVSDGTYLYGTSNTPRKRGLEDAVVSCGDVITNQGEIVWN